MRVMAIEEFGGPEKLRPMEVPRPRPARGEVLIRVVAAGVATEDVEICAGRLPAGRPHAFPLVPGSDVAGVVEELGDGTARFRKGDRVWAAVRKPALQWGCFAEYVAVPEEQVALMPARLLYEEAAAVPGAGLAAHQALFGRAGLDRGSRVLVQGASGGIGHLAVQLARGAGAEVLGVAPAEHVEFVHGLGAAAALDPAREDVAEAVRRRHAGGVDLAIHVEGDLPLETCLDLVRDGGRLVSFGAAPDEARARSRGVHASTLTVDPSAEQLALLAKGFDQKRLHVHVERIFRLPEAAAALSLLAQGPVRGKLVLNL